MRRLAAIVAGCSLALVPLPVHAASTWGSADYGDPPGWCTNFSDMWTATVVTNDPLVAGNPELETFYGFHANPGYDDWYGFFYGDFRGTPGDASGWIKLLHENYPRHYHWNFGDFGWAVHGHARQYIAYYNWTFGGQCGLGWRGSLAPPPYMADQYGYPIVDLYVDAVPPFPPQPYVAADTPSSVSFTWAAVADRGDGAGRDFFVSGLDHYASWVTVSDRPGTAQAASTAQPRTIEVGGLRAGETACVHVEAVDRVQNATPVEVACGAPAAPPPMPAWHSAIAVRANPAPHGLVGLDSWLWLTQAGSAMTADEWVGGAHYLIRAMPAEVDWDFGDGGTESMTGAAGFGEPYPARSSVSHVYGSHSQAGYVIRARVSYSVSWSEIAGGRVYGPFPLGSVSLDADPLTYPVEQAQPELLDV